MVDDLDWYCPTCADREKLHTDCSCGMRFTLDRREHAHYAVQLSWQNAEKLRERYMRKRKRVGWHVNKLGEHWLICPPMRGEPTRELSGWHISRHNDKAAVIETAAEHRISILDPSKPDGRIPSLVLSWLKLQGALTDAPPAFTRGETL